MAERGSVSEALLLDALRQEAAGRSLSAGSTPPSAASGRSLAGVLLIGMQSAATVSAANEIIGSDRLVLLHLDHATDAVGAGLGNREILLGDDLAPLAPFAVVGLNVEAAKSYRLLREIVGQTATYLDSAGVVLVAGPKKGGAEVAARVLRERFESVDLLAYRKGERIYRAAGPRPRADGEIEAVAPSSEVATVELRGCTLHLEQDERIFARGRLDSATRMLAEAFEINRGATVLDLGCGGGVLGILAALLEPSSTVVMVDSDPLAVEVSRRNAHLNGAPNVTVHLSDVLADLPDRRFDLVVMNPPFHRGRTHDASLAERFITEAARALVPGGSIYVVCNRFLRYEPILERLAGSVREVAGDRQFKVLLSRRSHRPDSQPTIRR